MLHEAAALEELHRCAPRWVVPPPVLRHGSWHGHELLVLVHCTGRSCPADDPVLVRAADEVARLRAVHSDLLPQSSYWTRLVVRQDALPATRFASMLVRARLSWRSERPAP